MSGLRAGARLPMILALLVVASLSALAWRGSHPTSSQGGGGPQAALSVDSESWDFGVVRSDATLLRHTFTVANPGPKPVRLRVAQIGCTCLGVNCPDAVPAGGTVAVDVDVNVANRQGEFATHATLTTSDPDRPQVRLTLRYYVQPWAAFDPAFFSFTDVKPGAVIERDLKVIVWAESESHGAEPPTVAAEHPAVQCDFQRTEPSTNTLGQLVRLIHHYRVRVDTSRLGSTAENVRLQKAIRASVRGEPERSEHSLGLEVRFQHHPDLTGQTSVTLRSEPHAKEVRVRIESREGKPFRVTNVRSPSNLIVARPASAEPAPYQDIALHSPSAENVEQRWVTVDVETTISPDRPYRIDVLLVP